VGRVKSFVEGRYVLVRFLYLFQFATTRVCAFSVENCLDGLVVRYLFVRQETLGPNMLFVACN
jgi:hypothetical protein